MKITAIGRGNVGGNLARLWTAAGHEVTTLGREGGDATGSDVVLVATPYDAVRAALEGVTGLAGTVVLDATNRLNGETPPTGYASNAELIKATTGGPVAKVFNLNYGDLFEKAPGASSRPSNIWVGDDDARAAVEQLSADVGMEAVNGGPLSRAATQEEFGYFMNSIAQDRGGLMFYRFALPDEF